MKNHLFLRCAIPRVIFSSFLTMAFGCGYFWVTLCASGASPRDLQWRFSGTTNDLTAAASSGASIVVVVGKHGTILTSLDTVIWTTQNSGTTNNISGVTYGNGVFVTVGGNSNGEVLTSPDGTSWTKQAFGVADALNAVTFGLGRFVAVGQHGAIWTSTNGLAWEQRPTGLASALSAVALGTIYTGGYPGGAMFVAVGQGGVLLTSSDGLAWTIRNSGVLLDLNSVTSVDCRTGSTVVFIAAGASGIAVKSSDGVNWTAFTIPTSQNITSAAGTGALGNLAIGVFALAGGNGTFLTSDDGISWSLQAAVTTNTFRGLLHVDGEFLAVGDAGIIRCGMAWVRRQTPTSVDLQSVAYGNGIYLAIGGNGIVLRSTDAINWSASNAGTQYLSSVTFAAGKFVAVGDGLSVLVSTNGLNWTTSFLPAPANAVSGARTMLKVVYGNGNFIASAFYSVQPGGSGGSGLPYADLLAISPDAVNWTVHTNLPAGYLFGYRLAASGGLGLFALSGQSLSSSSDGNNWTQRFANTACFCLVFGTNSFVGLNRFGQGGAPQLSTTSTDGTNWSYTVMNQSVPYDAMCYGAGYFMTIGSANGVLCFSASADNGTNWTSGVLSEAGFGDVAYCNNSFLVVGASGLVLQSTPTVLPVQLQMTIGSNSMKLLAIAQPGKQFELQQSTSFSTWNHWLNLTNSTDVTQIPVTNSGPGSKFFRAISN